MAKKPKHRDEDLFKDSTMTFGEHLEELRGALFKSLIFTVLAFVVVLALGWADKAVVFIQIPLTDALERYYANYSLKRAESRLAALQEAGVPVPTLDEVQDLVAQDRLVPQLTYIDLRQMIRVLNEAGFNIETSGIPQVLRTDFLNLSQFCDDVRSHRDEEGTPGHFIWQKLRPASDPAVDPRKIIEQGASDVNQVMPEQQALLAKELDEKVLTDPEFYPQTTQFFDNLTALGDRPWYDPRRWKDSIFGEYARQTKRAERLARIVAALPNANPDRLKNLNRQLLALAYPYAVPAGPRRQNMTPVLHFPSITDDPRLNPKSLNVQEMFMVWIKAAIVLSLVIASPFVFYFIWSFVAAGLYPHEKSYVFIYLPFSLGLFLAGCALCFFYVLQYVLDFLFLFNEWMNVDPDMRISEWFSFALFLPLGFGIAFQLPLVMLFLERIGVMTVPSYLAKWRVAVLVICVASAILTPADPYSMLLMAIPLVLLYFLGVAMCHYLPRRRNPFAEEEPTT